MTTLVITDHAVLRYQQRVASLTDALARAALDSPAVRTAAAFGAPFVRLSTGQRIVLRGSTIITVLPTYTALGSLDRRRDHGHD